MVRMTILGDGFAVFTPDLCAAYTEDPPRFVLTIMRPASL